MTNPLDYVRVGFSIPLHQQSQPQNPVLRPFERAAKLIAEWHYETETTGPLVCFFPLFQGQNHFSLLEIHERDMHLYHYDSMSQGDNAVVKAAREKKFPQFRYVEEVRSKYRWPETRPLTHLTVERIAAGRWAQLWPLQVSLGKRGFGGRAQITTKKKAG
ncbi:hypothetical protein S7711_11531 [Stachybotrys chartarum IBT 7711]|uniref:Ubiquitin-like protease family profile domain-containing protein n=1 Tax=Stachybotrys chartarum (strain CBS 109288 / IBT 7711) TaxID=1280523 RepID=A0A084AJR0_STACB|nr:hypothetical protein S7711_11531 [Stachybotrys chartarum IBT 7711]